MAINRTKGISYDDVYQNTQGLTRDQIADRAQLTTVGTITPSTSADRLVAGARQVTIAPPQVATPPQTFVERLMPSINQAGEYQGGLIRAQTEEAKMRDDVLRGLMDLERPDSQGTYDSAFKKAGGDEFLKQFTDANTRLTQLVGKFRTAKGKVSGAEGQSQAFEGVQLGEVSRQEAIEVGNQALVVQALQGNLDTARQIALDTTRFASEDRAATLQNLIAQYNALDGIVQGQEKQLIDNARIKAEREYDQLTRAQTTIDEAIKSGGATVDEMKSLSDLNLSTEQRLSLAQQIIARTSGSDRDLARSTQQLQNDLAKAGLSLEQQQYILDALQVGATVNPDGSLDLSGVGPTSNVETQVVDMNGRKILINKNTGETIRDLSAESVDNTEKLNKSQGIVNLIDEMLKSKGLTNAVGPISSKLPTMSGKRADFEAKFKELEALLSLENLGLLKGPMSDKDIEFIKQASSGMNLNMSESGFRDKLNQIRSKFQERIDNPALSSLQWKDPSSGQIIQFQDQNSYNQFLQETGQVMGPPNPNFNSAGKPQASNSGTTQKLTSLLTTTYKPGSIGPGTGAYQGQCGVFARSFCNSLGLTYPKLGDSLASKTAVVQKYGTSPTNAKIGSVVVTRENPTYGHVAVIIGANKNGYILAESNYAKAKTISYGRTIPFNSKSIVGIINPTRIG